MTSLYRYLLQLYPAAYQGDFSEEMLDVLHEAATAATKQGHLATLKFHFRETTGLLVGSIDERLRFLFGTYPVLPLPWRRFAMRSDFRFPKAVAPLMALVFALVLFTIMRASSLAVKVTSTHIPSTGEYFSLPLSVGLWLSLAYALGAAVWLILHSMDRSGSQRLSDADTWPQK